MIEMRWLVRRVRRPVGIDDGFYNPALDPMIDVPTLQYREWPPGAHPGTLSDIPPDYNSFGQPLTTTEPAWRDVPTVREP